MCGRICRISATREWIDLSSLRQGTTTATWLDRPINNTKLRESEWAASFLRALATASRLWRYPQGLSAPAGPPDRSEERFRSVFAPESGRLCPERYSQGWNVAADRRYRAA